MKEQARAGRHLAALAMVVVACGGRAQEASDDGSSATAGGARTGKESGGRNDLAAGGGAGNAAGPAERAPADTDLAGGDPASPSSTCTSSASPEVFARPTAITAMAMVLTATDVFWNDGQAIRYKHKATGESGTLRAVPELSAGVAVDDANVYWQNYPSLYTAPLDDSTSAIELATSASARGWAVAGGSLVYLDDPSAAGGGSGSVGAPSKLVRVARGGGAPLASVVQPNASAIGPFAADDTGVYFAYNGSNDPAGYGGGGRSSSTAAASGIRKLSLATGKVSDFAPVQLVVPGQLVATQGHVAFTDSAGDSVPIWVTDSDGEQRTQVATARLVRGLALDATHVYWAASEPGREYSDIYAAPLDGGAARAVACHVPYVHGLGVDDDHVYYFTYTENPVIARIAKR